MNKKNTVLVICKNFIGLPCFEGSLALFLYVIKEIDKNNNALNELNSGDC